VRKTAICLTVGAVLLAGSCGGPTDGGQLTPSSLTLLSGSGQTDTIGAHLTDPLVVRVLTSDNRGVPGVTVRFTASGNGSVTPDLATTDATGAASAHWTLRTLSGPDTVIATVAALTGQRAVFTATVSTGRLAILSITPDTVRFFKLHDTTLMHVQGVDRAANPVTPGALTWSTVAPAIATVTSTGIVRSETRGTTAVVALDAAANVRDTARVVVTQTPASIVIQPATDTLNWLGETVVLAAAASDSGGAPITGVPLTWQSLDGGVASVDSVGHVTAIFAGGARIVASYLGIADTASITVRQIPATVSIAVGPDTLIAFDDTATAAGFVQDSGGGIMSSATIAFSSSNSAIAQFVAPRKIVARDNGSLIVTGSYASLTDTATLVVRQRLADVQVQPTSALLAIDQTTQFHAIPYDRRGHAIDTTIVPLTGRWRTLHVDWLTVDSTGFATARAAGLGGAVFVQDTTADTALATVLAPSLGPVTSWEWKNPLPQGNQLLSVGGNADNNIYAVGQAGTIVHFDGVNWSAQPRINVPVLIDVWVSPTGQVFMSGGDEAAHGLVVHGTGAPWTIDTIPPYSLARAIWGASDTSVFVINDAFRVVKFNGTSWAEIGNLPVNQVQDIEGVSSQLVYVAGGVQAGQNTAGAIFRYDGVNWTQVYQGFTSIMGLWVAPDSSVYALGRGQNCTSSVLHSNGAAWDTVATLAADLFSIHGRTPQDIYAVGSCGSLDSKAHWNGSAWSLEQEPQLNGPRQLWVSPGGEWVTVGAYGAIQTNSGSGWLTVTSGLRGFDNNIREGDMWLWSANDVYVTARNSRLLRWNGTSLAEMPNPLAGAPSPVTGSDRPMNAIWGTSPSNLYMGGGSGCFTPPLNCDGMLERYNGSSWSVVYSQGIIIDVIWGTAPDDIFALGLEAGLHFDGTQWTRTGQGVFEGRRIKAVWGNRSNDVWACSDTREVFHYNGVSWSRWGSTSIGCGSLFGFAANDIYMSGFSDGLNGTVNTIGHYDGNTWTVEYTGLPPGGGSYDQDNVWGSGPQDVHAAFYSEYVRFNGSSWVSQPLIPLAPVMIRGDSKGAIFGSGEIAGLVIGHQ